ncbi:MAG TPA: hypothetical protein VG929_12255 [Actinomycetota bacterium]|nr:hypothetical protein [Actinomycetota bacterium]
MSTSVAATSAPAAGDTAATSETSAGACKYVTVAEASQLAASPVKPGVNTRLPNGPVTFESCDYIFEPGNAPAVTVAVADLGADGAALFRKFSQSKTSESAYQEVSGVGDDAFFAGQNLYVRDGDTGLILYVGRSTGDPEGSAR